MQTIDFLPIEYRQEHLRRQLRPRQAAVAAVFVLLLIAAVLGQYFVQRKADEALAAIQPQYDLVQSQNQQLAAVEAELKSAENQARLLTYLRCQWPRTQLLAALLAPLPDQIALEQLQISSEPSEAALRNSAQSRADRAAEDEKRKKLSPVELDIEDLRRQFDQTPTTIRLTGTAHSSKALHEYLQKLGANSLLAKVELNSIESAKAGHSGVGAVEFRATATARPGYGQPGGPTGKGASR